MKSKIVEALEMGESGRSLSESYGVGAATVSAIKKRGGVIQDCSKRLVDEVGCTKRKVMRSSKVEEVEEALYAWFIQNRIAGNPISGTQPVRVGLVTSRSAMGYVHMTCMERNYRETSVHLTTSGRT
uniref:HTH psq-type domain-containing protein n=1 Tax=Trichuris muris TaxID=70415 RepID=A0A5S6QAB9_TRIMR